MQKLTLKCVDFRPVRKNTLQGFATIRIAELRLTVCDVAIHEHSNGARWAALPSKAQVDRDGVARRGPDGKIAYSPVFEFDSRAVRDAFSAAAIRAVLDFDAAAFAADAEATP